MKNISPLCSFIFAFFFLACSAQIKPTSSGDPKLRHENEAYLANIRQLTYGGTNAEAYWSQSGSWLTYQHKGKEDKCDQIYALSADGKQNFRISSGKGRTTCSYFFNDDARILYSSTHAAGPECPPDPDHSKGYVWPVYPIYRYYSVKFMGKEVADESQNGKDLLPMEPGAPNSYNAEMTTCKDNAIFTSDRDGDIELYAAKIDSLGTLKDVKRLTHAVGYDGGAYYSNDCKKIVWRANRPKDAKEKEAYQALLKQHLVKPAQVELWVSDADGKNAFQVTRNGMANFAPYFTPDAKRILFSSNLGDQEQRRQFDIYIMDVSGARLEKVTQTGGFNSFPMLSPDGKYLAFSSSRNALMPRENNVFIADWIDQAPRAISANSDAAVDRFQAMVETLSQPDLKGRGLETPGAAHAETLVAGWMRDAGLTPIAKSFPQLKGASDSFQTVSTLVDGKAVTSHNVISTYGNGCGKKPSILIGAHLDHLGMGAANSLNDTKKGLHPGADDNASGVAALLEVARNLKQFALIDSSRAIENGCWIFAAFTAEESGVVGSTQLANSLKELSQLPKAMLNMDMVGRLRNNSLLVFGSASAKEWASLLNRNCETAGLTCGGGGDGYGPSDHMPFFAAGVPVLHFFTGPHEDYHRSSDTAEKINSTGGVHVAQLVANVAVDASRISKFNYIKAGPAPMMGRLAMNKRNSKGAYLGTIPNYGTMASAHGVAEAGAKGTEGGVPLMGVRSGSPADKAGLKEGDILTGIVTTANSENGPAKIRREIKNLEGYMNILMDLEPGQPIEMEVLREGKPLLMSAVVGKKQ